MSTLRFLQSKSYFVKKGSEFERGKRRDGDIM